MGAARSVDGRIAEVRQRVAEAERDAQEDFEVLRSHLKSVEHVKLSVLDRERDVRTKIAEDIDAVVEQVRRAEMVSGADAMSEFVRDFPGLRARAEALWSRSLSLPSVEVTMDDIPFEARAKVEYLRRYAVIDRVLHAKDCCLWRLEQHRRALAQEARDATSWVRHFEGVLERYTEKLSHVCYFCNERFAAESANGRCPYNAGVSPRSGRALAADPRVPGHLWGCSSHYWIPQQFTSGSQGRPPDWPPLQPTAASAPVQLGRDRKSVV